MLGIIELLILLVFCFFRFGKKTLIAASIFSLAGIGLSFIRPSFDKKEYSALVTEVKDNYFIVSSSFEKLYVYQKEHSYEIGDILLIKGVKKEIESSVTESSFDFKLYLENKGVYHQLSPSNIKVKFSTPFRLHKVKKQFLQHLDSNSKALVGSLLFSMGSEEEVYHEAQELHLMRLLSNSGIYLAALYSVLSYLISYLLKNDKIKDLVLIGLFLPTLIFSFPRFVVIKFVLLKLLRWINNHLLKKRFSYLEVVSISALFFLLIDYHLAYQSGFIHTYFIPIAAYLFSQSFRSIKRFKKKMLISGLILVSFIPFTLSFYQEISPLSPLYQIILLPFFLIYYFLSLLSFIGVPIYALINNYGQFLANAIHFFNRISFKIYGMEMNGLTITLFEIVYFICVYYSASRFKPMMKISFTLFFLLNIYYFIPVQNLLVDEVSFINVGQGDATLIRRKSTAILIDTGGSVYKDLATESLIPYLKKQRIYDIDLLITTHDDFDHMGATSSLIENFTVKRYIKDYQDFPISLGGFTLTNYNIYPELWLEENDSSLVIGFQTKKYHYLVMGDAPKKIEERIMNDNKRIPCDILKVGHHGSKTSSGDKFIKYLSPKVGIISCGKNNKYGHPNYEVIATLRKYHVTIRRTDLEGTITYWQ